MEQLGELLKRLRAQHGLTQEEVVEHLFVSQPTYSQCENGHVRPPLERLHAIADLYHLDIAVFLALLPRPSGKRRGAVPAVRNDALEGIAAASSTGDLRMEMLQCAADMHGITERLAHLLSRMPEAMGERSTMEGGA